MEVNPQDVIKILSEEITRLNIELAVLKAALSKQGENGTQEAGTGSESD